MLRLTAWLIVVACLVEVVGYLAKVRVRQLQAQEACREAFYRFAENLASDPETPEPVVDIIKLLPKWVTSKVFWWRFIIALLLRRVRRQRWDSLEIYNQIPYHLRSDYVGLLVSFVFALTYNNLVIGEIARRLFLYSIPDDNDADIGRVSPLGPMIDEFSHHHVH